jgi:hypothetical protein
MQNGWEKPPNGDVMNRFWVVAAILLLGMATSALDCAFAQKGGARAGGGLRGVAVSAPSRGVAAAHRASASSAAAIRGGVVRPGWGWRRGWGSPVVIGVTGGSWDYYANNTDECLFLTHHGWINTCF